MRRLGQFSPELAAIVAGVFTMYRANRNLTQRAAAELSGMGCKSICALETGFRTDALRLAQAWKLLTAYGVTLAQFEADVTAMRARMERIKSS